MSQDDGGLISPDGNYRWTGAAWEPIAREPYPAPPSPPGPAPSSAQHAGSGPSYVYAQPTSARRFSLDAVPRWALLSGLLVIVGLSVMVGRSVFSGSSTTVDPPASVASEKRATGKLITLCTLNGEVLEATGDDGAVVGAQTLSGTSENSACTFEFDMPVKASLVYHFRVGRYAANETVLAADLDKPILLVIT